MENTLRKGPIGMREILLQDVASAAPARAAVSTLAGTAAFALGSLSLTALFGFPVSMSPPTIMFRHLSYRYLCEITAYPIVVESTRSSPDLELGYLFEKLTKTLFLLS